MGKLDSNGFLVTKKENFGKYVRLILYNINLLRKITKTVLQQNSFIFRLYDWTSNIVRIY